MRHGIECVGAFMAFAVAVNAMPLAAQPAGRGGPPPVYYEGEERKNFVGNAGSFYPGTEIGSTASPEVTAAIETLVTDFASRWTAERWTTVKDLFDPDDDAPYVLMVHQPDWLVGWDQLNNYFSEEQKTPVKEVPDGAPDGIQQIEASHYEYRTESELSAMMYTADRVAIHEIDDDLAMATWYVDFQYKPGFMPAKGEHFKANAMFRNTKDGWKFIHYGEAAMSPIMYMERLYRSQVSQKFLDTLPKGGPPAGF